eukprot:3389597-Pyramimonas_sp.AAC.1
MQEAWVYSHGGPIRRRKRPHVGVCETFQGRFGQVKTPKRQPAGAAGAGGNSSSQGVNSSSQG